MADVEEEMVQGQETTESTAEDNAEAQAEGEEGAGVEDVQKTEEELEQELKETQISITRYTPHIPPEMDMQAMRERWPYHLRIYPIDQEDCRNCILDTATKIAQESWYYVPKRKNGPGYAELAMNNNNEATSVLARVIRMPFYHQFVTLELTRRSQESEEEGSPYNKIEETAKIVFDSTKCERIKNTATSKGNLKRRSLWVRYLPENTTKEFLRVLFPLSLSTQIETHDNLRIGLVEAHSKTDVMVFVKAYLTVVIDDVHILALQNKEPAEKESETKAELEKTVTPLAELEGAPTEVADRSDQRKDDKNNTSRVLKRTLHQQHRMNDRRRDHNMGAKRGRGGEPLNKRGPGWNDWNDRGFDRRGGGRFSGGGGFPPAMGGRPGYGGAGDMAAEMMMMQAQLNQTIQNQLMMLNPGQRGGGGGGGYGGRRDGRGGGGGRGGRGGRGGGGGGRNRW